MRLVLPTARSPTTLILSFRRRIRKASASPLPASKALRDDYQPINSANRTLGRDRTGGNPSRAHGGIGFQAMDSGGAKITLDQESFKALASDVRVGILKRLDTRRETVTDLSNLLSLSKPTLLEHLEKLQSAGLVKRVDEGRKWIYYELSDKGRKILHPERVAITLVLGLAVALAAIGAFLVISASSGGLGAAPMYNASAPAASAPSTFGVFDPLVGDLFLVVFVSFVVAILVHAFLRRRVRQRAPTKPFSWWQVISSAIGLILIIALLLAWPRMLQAFRVGQTAPTTGDAGAASGSGWPVAAGAPLGLFLGLTVLVTIVILVVLLRRGAGVVEIEAEPLEDDPAARHAAADAVQDAIEELEVGGDVRSVILACFRRFCALLGARGITAQDALTPRELEVLAVERLHVSREASETLTSLFEEARYSEHPLGEADRHRAIESLAGIRVALGA